MGSTLPYFMGSIMKKEYGYFDILLGYQRASSRRGIVPTKVYLTTDQICELECECIFRNIAEDHLLLLDATILGMQIVNIDMDLENERTYRKLPKD